MTAFVSGSSALSTYTFVNQQLKSSRLSYCHSLQSTTRKSFRPLSMKAQPTEQKESPYKMVEENMQAKKNAEYRGPQGFTPYAETVNGRLAMIGFFTMIVAELLNPSHPSLLKQLEIIFPLDKLPFISSILG